MVPATTPSELTTSAELAFRPSQWTPWYALSAVWQMRPSGKTRFSLAEAGLASFHVCAIFKSWRVLAHRACFGSHGRAIRMYLVQRDQEPLPLAATFRLHEGIAVAEHGLYPVADCRHGDRQLHQPGPAGRSQRRPARGSRTIELAVKVVRAIRRGH